MKSFTRTIMESSRLYSVRLVRWLFCLVWNSRVGWAFVCLVSLITLYYQWENWRSARELKAAHQRLVERLGTDDMQAFASPTIPDEQNYFALPVISQWATGELRKGGPFNAYVIPQDTFWPKGLPKPAVVENETDGTSWLDWSAGHDLKGDNPAMVLNRALGDANGVLTKLAEGLDRPFACFKPGLREAMEAAGENQSDIDIPDVRRIIDHQRNLCLHLRCAAAAGDAVKARQVALISLRLFAESAAAHGTLVISLQSLACHGLVFKALQDALGHAVWDEASLHALQLQLGMINDLRMMEHAMGSELLWGLATSIGVRDGCGRGEVDLFKRVWGSSTPNEKSSLGDWVYTRTFVYGPTGWHNANIAFYVNAQLDLVGPEGETQWTSAGERHESVRARVNGEVPLNPRRLLGYMNLPNLSSLYPTAAKTLFRRRCLIVACALERHRLLHGSYPVSMNDVEKELKPFDVTDPARPTVMPGYRLEKSGYLLWSAGPDMRDDGGVPDKDWLWRMKFNPQL